MRFEIFQINVDFLINYLQKYFYTKHLRLLLHFQKNCALHRISFSKHPLFTTCQLVFSNNLTQETLYPSFISKKTVVSIANLFRNNHFFPIFSLFLKVGEVCNISNKCWFLNKSANKIFLHKTPYNTTQSCAVDRRRFQKGRLFTTFLPNLIENEVCNISNKYRSCKSLRTY